MKKQKKQNLVSMVVILSFLLTTAWLFFDFALTSVLLLFLVPISWRRQKQERLRKEKWALNLAFKDALVCLENALAVGYSPESSVREAVKSLEQLYGEEHEICLEFHRMVQQMALGYSMEQAFLEFGQRSEVEDIRQLAEIFSIVKRTGGNLGQVLRQTGSVLQAKIELKRELHGAIAAKQMEFQIMGVVPYGILLYLKVCAPEMSGALYEGMTGVLFMWGVLAAYLALKILGERIIQGEIGKLEGQ